MGRIRFNGGMAFIPNASGSGKASFTTLNRLCRGVNAPFPDGVNALPPLKIRLLLATCLLVTCNLSAQPKAFASLQPERIETGDTTALLVIVSGLKTEPKDVDFSPWASVFPISNIIGRSDWRRSGAQWTRRFTLIAFDSASLKLPPLNVRLGVGKPLETNELTLTVFPTRGGREITDMAKIRDIRREPVSWLDYWPWGAGVLAMLALFLWWFRKNRRKPQPVVIQTAPAPVQISASEKALQQLSQLQQKQLWKNGQTKEHYAELSLVLREYLETRYSIAALESTTVEIQKLIAATDFPPDRRPDLKELLQKTDLVKYAQSQPAEAVHEAVLAKARELVAPGNYVRKQSQQASEGEITQHQQRKTPPPKPKTGKYEPL
ncbi:MAG: hypothetical protein H7246_20215 [Phycisphaerae bacterium]|nr:hypothetical protein [Saprospiraceae bacterium]